MRQLYFLFLFFYRKGNVPSCWLIYGWPALPLWWRIFSFISWFCDCAWLFFSYTSLWCYFLLRKSSAHHVKKISMFSVYFYHVCLLYGLLVFLLIWNVCILWDMLGFTMWNMYILVYWTNIWDMIFNHLEWFRGSVIL